MARIQEVVALDGRESFTFVRNYTVSPTKSLIRFFEERKIPGWANASDEDWADARVKWED